MMGKPATGNVGGAIETCDIVCCKETGEKIANEASNAVNTENIETIQELEQYPEPW